MFADGEDTFEIRDEQDTREGIVNQGKNHHRFRVAKDIVAFMAAPRIFKVDSSVLIKVEHDFYYNFDSYNSPTVVEDVEKEATLQGMVIED